MELIDHFTTCYEAVKQQLQEERTKERESVLISRAMTIGETTFPPSRNYLHKSAKQVRLSFFQIKTYSYLSFANMNRLRPLMIQQEHSHDQGPVIEQCVGISPSD